MNLICSSQVQTILIFWFNTYDFFKNSLIISEGNIYARNLLKWFLINIDYDLHDISSEKSR